MTTSSTGIGVSASCIVFAALLSGCSTADFDATNAKLRASRIVFLHEQQFDILSPPLFASSRELDAHLAGRSDAYERRFQDIFPDEQETWLARFQPVDALPAALQRAAPPPAADSSSAAAPPTETPTFYLVPLEGVGLPFVQQVEQAVRAAGYGCVANKPGDATQLPMPPRGGAVAPSQQAEARVR